MYTLKVVCVDAWEDGKSDFGPITEFLDNLTQKTTMKNNRTDTNFIHQVALVKKLSSCDMKRVKIFLKQLLCMGYNFSTWTK